MSKVSIPISSLSRGPDRLEFRGENCLVDRRDFVEVLKSVFRRGKVPVSGTTLPDRSGRVGTSEQDSVCGRPERLPTYRKRRPCSTPVDKRSVFSSCLTLGGRDGRTPDRR